MSEIRPAIQQDQRLILRANEQLEHVYLKNADPSVALLLTRNYNLLTQQQNQIDQRLNFVQKAKFWWQCYLKLSTGKKMNLSVNLDSKQPSFKPISI